MERAPLPDLPLLVPVPEDVELLLVLVLLPLLLGDPEPELLEPPLLLLLAGGAKRGGNISYVILRKRTTEKLTSSSLDLKLGSSGINVRVVGWVNELDGVTGSRLQGHIGDGKTLNPRVSPSKTKKKKRVRVYGTSTETSIYSIMENAPFRMVASSFAITIEIGEGSPFV